MALTDARLSRRVFLPMDRAPRGPVGSRIMGRLTWGLVGWIALCPFGFACSSSNATNGAARQDGGKDAASGTDGASGPREAGPS